MTETKRLCAGCDHPAHNQRVICVRCEGEARRKLSNQTSLHDDLTTEYLRLVRKTEQLRVTSARSFPIPYEAKAADLLRRQHSWLEGWTAVVLRLRPQQIGPYCGTCRHTSCKTVRDTQPPTTPQIPDMACYVEAALPILRKKPEAAQLLSELRKLTGDIITVIDLPEIRTRINAGPCPKLWPHEGVEEPCPGQVEAIVPADETIPAVLRCTACHAEWPSVEWTTAGKRILARSNQIKQQQQLAKQFAKGAA